MRSKITDKFQITIPKEIRRQLKLSRKDALEWNIEAGKVVVRPVKNPLLNYKGTIQVGAGNIKKDIEKARKMMAEKIK